MAGKFNKLIRRNIIIEKRRTVIISGFDCRGIKMEVKLTYGEGENIVLLTLPSNDHNIIIIPNKDVAISIIAVLKKWVDGSKSTS